MEQVPVYARRKKQSAVGEKLGKKGPTPHVLCARFVIHFSFFLGTWNQANVRYAFELPSILIRF